MTRSITMICLMATLLFTACSSTRTTPLAMQQTKINDLNERALASAEKGYDADAQKLLREALQLASSLDNKEGQIITLLNQSRLARHNRNVQLSALSLEQAMTQSAGTIYYADVAQEKALHELAVNHLDEATHWAEIARDAEQGNLIGRRFNLLARIALKKNEVSVSERFAEQALAATKNVGQESEQANTLRILGIIKARTGQWDKAEKLLQEALTLDRQQATPAKIASDLEALAELAGLKKEPARQQEFLQRAKVVRENSQINRKK